MMVRTYLGSCHCQAVRFEVDLDLSGGTGKCNCSFCTKARLWSATVKPENIRIVSGEADIVDYRGRNNAVAHHLFCRHCGVRPFEWVDVPNASGEKYYNVNVACLEGVDIEQLIAAPISYFDGLNDKWEEVPSEIRHL